MSSSVREAMKLSKRLSTSTCLYWTLSILTTNSITIMVTILMSSKADLLLVTFLCMCWYVRDPTVSDLLLLPDVRCRECFD